MRLLPLLLLLLTACTIPDPEGQARDVPMDGPIQLHPHNPHYLLYRGQTTLLVTSAEHYGAVLN
ncbi:MAG: hypothetical protein D6722_23315, partial [Bacteroidetes bacterium]